LVLFLSKWLFYGNLLKPGAIYPQFLLMHTFQEYFFFAGIPHRRLRL